MFGRRKENSVVFRGPFGGVRGRETEEARDRGGVAAVEDATEFARVKEVRRSGSGGDGGTRTQPNRDARTEVSEGSVAVVVGRRSCPSTICSSVSCAGCSKEDIVDRSAVSCEVV